jgi:hypothetical protein
MSHQQIENILKSDGCIYYRDIRASEINLQYLPNSTNYRIAIETYVQLLNILNSQSQVENLFCERTISLKTGFNIFFHNIDLRVNDNYLRVLKIILPQFKTYIADFPSEFKLFIVSSNEIIIPSLILQPKDREFIVNKLQIAAYCETWGVPEFKVSYIYNNKLLNVRNVIPIRVFHIATELQIVTDQSAVATLNDISMLIAKSDNITRFNLQLKSEIYESNEFISFERCTLKINDEFNLTKNRILT